MKHREDIKRYSEWKSFDISISFELFNETFPERNRETRKSRAVRTCHHPPLDDFEAL